MMKRYHLGLSKWRIEIASGKDAGLKALAQKIIDDQQKKINEVDKFLSGHKTHNKTDFAANVVKMMDKSPEMNMTMDGKMLIPFCNIMIRHHQRQIDIEKEYLKTGS